MSLQTRLSERLAAHGLQANKGLGQHFLLDLNVTRKIARLSGAQEGDHVLDFAGAGVLGGDRLLLQGYATGVKLVFDAGSALWSVQETGVTVESFAIEGVTQLISSDFAFIA